MGKARWLLSAAVALRPGIKSARRKRGAKIIIIDAVDAKRKPGEVFSLNADELPQNKVDNYTLHQMPTSNLLRELKEFCKVDVTIIAGQIDHIPEAVKPGLSDVLMESVAVAAEEVLKSCNSCLDNMKEDTLWKMKSEILPDAFLYAVTSEENYKISLLSKL
jgi:hydrogenase maturation protease